MDELKSLEDYIVGRLKSLENEAKQLNEDCNVLREELAKVEDMKKVMRAYFRLGKYAGGDPYIDHTYNAKSVPVIAEFIGLTDNNEEEDDENV